MHTPPITPEPATPPAAAPGPWRARLDRAMARYQRSAIARIVDRFIEIDVMTQAASLTFYALISLAPLLVLVLWLAASLYPDAQQALLVQIGELAGQDVATVARTVLANANEQPDVGSLAGLWGTILLFVGATTVFARLQATLNLIFHTSGGELGGIVDWLRKRVFSFGVVFALGFLVIVSTLLTAVLNLVLAEVPALVAWAGDLAASLIYVLAFALLYKYLPDRPVRWRQAWIGGAITTALFLVGRWAIGLYLSEAAPGSAYGAFGTVVIALLWTYYTALVFFGGALVTAVIDERLTGAATRDDTTAPGR